MKPSLPTTFCLVFLLAPSASFVLAQSAAVEQAVNQATELPFAAPEAVGMSSAKLAVVDQIMQGYVDDGDMVGGIVMIASHGKICFFEDYGMADRENGKAMNKDAILRFYSMTKAITTTAALMLHDAGKLNVNDPVSKYIPALAELRVVPPDHAEGDDDDMDVATLPQAKNPITIADLMRHTSGLTYGRSSSELHNRIFKKQDPIGFDIALADMPDRLKNVPLRFEPSTGWEYGISTDVLGLVVQVASGQPFEDFLRERILDPLDMRDTGFDVPAEKQSRFAACYQSTDNGFELITEEWDKYVTRRAFKSGGGGLVSTARDYMRFLLMIERGGELDGHRYLRPETMKWMTTNQIPEEAGWIRFGDEVRDGVGFSFGFSVRDEMSDWDPSGRVGEYGWGGAASTHYWISPKDELIVITLEQVKPYRWLTELGLKQAIYDSIVE